MRFLRRIRNCGYEFRMNNKSENKNFKKWFFKDKDSTNINSGK